ncbi:MAG: SBBP repeat-containing protein [Polyangiales bacterium]
MTLRFRTWITLAAACSAGGCTGMSVVGGLGLDAAPDVAPDVTPPDAPPDAAPDALADASAPDVAPDVPDLDAPDVAPDLPSDLVSDLPSDLALDVPLDLAPDGPAPDAPRCDPGETACGAACFDLQWESARCGSCTTVCPPGMPCSRGRCATACDPPRALCTEGGLARCVELQTDPTHCGACGRVCGEGQSCVGGRCECGAGRTQCGARCVDLDTDPGSCGGCGVVCPAALNGRAVCRAGICGVECGAGFHVCGIQCVDDRSPLTCGTACTACPSPSGMMATCNGAACGLACLAGTHLCSGVCVSNSVVATCGDRCAPCPAPANGVANCAANECGFACNTGYHACAATCANNLLVATCGTRCDPCPDVANATATCDGRVCGFTCVTGFANCDGNAANGCEVDTRSSPANCGACARACAAVAGAVPTCTSSTCGFACAAGRGNCDANPTNGCEADITNNPSACGACGRACATGEVCNGGTCRVPRPGWLTPVGGEADDELVAVAADDAGNTVAAGAFRGVLRLAGMAPLTSEGASDVVVLSLSPDGSIRWARRLGGPGTDAANAVGLDPAGNVYVVGSFTAMMDFGMGPIPASGESDAFVVSYTSAGAPRWSRTFGGDGPDAAFAVAVDAQGPYVAGTVRGRVDFGAGPTTGSPSAEAFVAALDLEGSPRWTRRFGPVSPRTGSAAAYGVAVAPDGAVAMVGFFQGAIDVGADVLASAGNYDMLIASLSATGAPRWSRRVGAASVDWAQAVAVDPAGNLFVTGYYQGTVDFGGGASTAVSGTDGFVVSYTAGGGHRWWRRFGGGTGYFGTATGYGVRADAAGNVVVGGLFAGNVDFGNGLRTSAGLGDAFLASYTNAGTPRWSRRFGGAREDAVRAIALDGSAAVYAVGSFDVTVDFGFGAIAAQGEGDGFVYQFLQ